MVLIWFISILMFGGILAWIVGEFNVLLSRWISLIALLIDFILSIYIWIQGSSGANDTWIFKYAAEWIPAFGVSFSLALDGLSLLMLLLTFFLGIFAVLISWNEIQERVGFFHFNLLWVLAGI